MTLNEYYIELDNLSEKRRLEAAKIFLSKLDPIKHNGFIQEMMVYAADWEIEDYFGTEGMEV